MPGHGSGFIIPRYKMILSYDVPSASYESYYQFVLRELVPALQEEGLYMVEVWHTAYGDYPLRMVGFVAEDFYTIRELLSSKRWRDLEHHLLSYVRNYSCQIVRYRQGFQFVR
jgi:hypothetical protein